MKTIHVTVSISISDDADAHETIQECDYSFSGEGIISTEIVEVIDENSMTVFS